MNRKTIRDGLIKLGCTDVKFFYLDCLGITSIRFTFQGKQYEESPHQCMIYITNGIV